MLTLFIALAAAVGYIIAGSLAFGYVRGACNHKNGWETPIPFLSAIFWPVTLLVICFRSITVPAQALGFSLQQKSLEKKRKRIAQQEQIRIDIKKADEELDEIFQEMEKEELKTKTI